MVKGEITKRLKTIFAEPDSDEEREALNRCLAMMEAEAGLSRRIKATQSALDVAVLGRYAALSEGEIKTLTIQEKWFATIQASVQDEVQRLTQALIGRVKELEERYAAPLPGLETDVESLSTRVVASLRAMGYQWAAQ